MDPVLARQVWVNHSLSLSAVDMNSSSSTQKGPSLSLSVGGQGAGHQLQNKTTGSPWGVHPGDPNRAQEHLGCLRWLAIPAGEPRKGGKDRNSLCSVSGCLSSTRWGLLSRDRLPGLCSYLAGLGSSAAGCFGFSPDLFMDGPGTPSTKFLERTQTSFV